jgi:hypothetical protein
MISQKLGIDGKIAWDKFCREKQCRLGISVNISEKG